MSEMSEIILLKGDELLLNGPNYAATINGEEVFLGKLLRREKSYSYFNETYSLYNNVFVFEKSPSNIRFNNCFNIRIFYEINNTEYVLK